MPRDIATTDRYRDAETKFVLRLFFEHAPSCVEAYHCHVGHWRFSLLLLYERTDFYLAHQNQGR